MAPVIHVNNRSFHFKGKLSNRNHKMIAKDDEEIAYKSTKTAPHTSFVPTR